MLTIRFETPTDLSDIYNVNEVAFGRKMEAELIDRLRDRGQLVVSLVAMSDEKVVGHIAFSPAEIKSDDGGFGAMALGPIAVLPQHQRQGIGSRLVTTGLEECRRLGYELVVLVGHPDYYPRFGFVPAGARGIECEFEAPDEAWMLLELAEGALSGRRGKAFFQPAFREALRSLNG